MTKLPQAFTDYTCQLMGKERFERYLKSFEKEPPVSIRLNPRKARGLMAVGGKSVPWCRNAFYIEKRPNFTMDPLFHAGCYYVQEAASMFLDEILRQQCSMFNVQCSIDLCAAPGGKSTLLRSALPEDCVLYSNEPVRNRANILAENVAKWGWPNHIVTNNYPEAFRKSKCFFDLILCDVPCSGEGMFRKDEATISEWSPEQVEKCSQLQRNIVADAWTCLNPGGLLIYSTCTFNIKENEENVRWFLEQYDDAEMVPIVVRPEWNITGSLLEGFKEPVYRFIPGITHSEGLFVCVLRKRDGNHRGKNRSRDAKTLTILPQPVPTPSPYTIDIDYLSAMAYLRGEALLLPPDTPRGEVTICFEGYPLGLVKNVGSRANNLYPKAWRIKTTHIPSDYKPILKIK